MKTLIVIVGPTGVGKTEMCINIAQYFKIPIINADSRQIYRGLAIGTAAPTKEQQTKVTHHFVEQLELEDYYSAAIYEEEVCKHLEEHFKKHDIALMSGGSMMYIDAVCNGIDDIPTVDTETRDAIMKRYNEQGLEPLLAELRYLDPEYYNIVDKKNPKRIIHALEICTMTGQTYTSFRTNKRKKRPFNIIKIGLNRERAELYERINKRVDIMIEDGLLEEAKSVYPQRHLNSLNTLGYKEMFEYIEVKLSLSEAVFRIQCNSRKYARKQLTWFKRDDSITWFHPDKTEDIMNHIKNNLE